MNKYLTHFYTWLGVLNDLLLVPMFAIIFMQLSDNKGLSAFSQQDMMLNACFFLEWVLGLYLAENKKQYLLSFPKMLDFISCLPWGLTKVARLARISRAFKLVRVVTRAKRYSGPGEELLRVAALVGATIFAGAYSISVIEPHNPQIQGFFDALWWSLVTVSTVGYGDITPESNLGRLVAAPLIAVGVGVCGYVAGFMSRVMNADDKQDETRVLEIEEKLDRISAQLEDLAQYQKAPLGDQQASHQPEKDRVAEREQM